MRRGREKSGRKGEKGEEENAPMGAALFKRGWGCQIELPPRTTAPRGRLPGRWRSRAASGCREVASVTALASACACAGTRVYTCASRPGLSVHLCQRFAVAAVTGACEILSYVLDGPSGFPWKDHALSG